MASFGSTGLTEVTIPKKVKNIATRAFGGCSSLASVTVLATVPPTLGENVFNNCSESLIIYVPSESVAEYKSKWSDYTEKIEPIQ
ncbi:leucine-rich repeat protein [Bacteroides sp. CR5/BHMF/2]|nr:leucine-rich repeat protein [Bacteroides sp. CR5/BHMF/2]